MNVITECIIVFLTQLVFIWSRTLNVKAIANKNIKSVLLTGALVHLAWLVGIAIGASNTYKIINDFKIEYLPVIIFSLAGGLVGSYFAMVNKN